VDIFVEETAFTLRDAERVFRAGKDHGLGLRIHADQFSSSGGALLAAEYGAWSADHLDYSNSFDIKALAMAGVTAVLLPGAVFYLGREKYAPARAMIEAGCKVALSTDFNPGSSPTQSLPLMMTLGCNRMKMTPEEALQAVTLGAATTLRRDDRIGTLLPGYQADLCLWDVPDVDTLAYRFGDTVPAAVYKRGRLAAVEGRLVKEYRLPSESGK
jgi:imidazolonepropionase